MSRGQHSSSILILTFFSSAPLPEPRWTRWMSLWGWPLKSLYSLHFDQLWANCDPYREKLLWPRLRAPLICGYKYTYLKAVWPHVYLARELVNSSISPRPKAFWSKEPCLGLQYQAWLPSCEMGLKSSSNLTDCSFNLCTKQQLSDPWLYSFPLHIFPCIWLHCLAKYMDYNCYRNGSGNIDSKPESLGSLSDSLSVRFPLLHITSRCIVSPLYITSVPFLPTSPHIVFSLCPHWWPLKGHWVSCQTVSLRRQTFIGIFLEIPNQSHDSNIYFT